MDETIHPTRSPEHLADLRERGRQLGRLGGRPRKPTALEARAAALRELEPQAVRVLREQLASRDQHLRFKAAVKVLEYVYGKPTQRLVGDPDEPVAIAFLSEAIRPGFTVRQP